MKELCPVDVFDVKKTKNKSSLIVKNPDKCTFCRACINDEELGDKILLAKQRENYKFTIESVGAIEPVDLMKRAIKKLLEKVKYYKEYL